MNRERYRTHRGKEHRKAFSESELAAHNLLTMASKMLRERPDKLVKGRPSIADFTRHALVDDIRTNHTNGERVLQPYRDGVVFSYLGETFMRGSVQIAFIFPDEAEPEYYSGKVVADNRVGTRLHAVLGAQDIGQDHWLRREVRDEVYPRILAAHLMEWEVQHTPDIVRVLRPLPLPIERPQQSEILIHEPNPLAR